MATEDRRRRNAASRVYGLGSGNAGFGPSSGLLAPEDNPAYQAAIAKGRPSRSGFTSITTPSGGRMSVPVGRERQYTDLLSKGGATGAPTGFERPDTQSAYALGSTGVAPTGNTPFERSYRMGFEGEGSVQQPQSSFGFQVGNILRNTASGIVPFAQNAASRIAGAFGGIQAPSPGSLPTQQNQPATGTNTSIQPPSAPITGKPLADGRSDLLRDTENTFYGGGNAPVPTPTPTASPSARLAYNQPSGPRRYSDYF